MVALTSLMARPALAATHGANADSARAHSNFELGVSTGGAGSGRGFSRGGGSYAGTGLGGEVELEMLVGRGFVRFGGYASYGPYRARIAPRDSAETLTCGLEAMLLFAPGAKWQPDLTLGAGYRALVLDHDPGNRTLYDGFEFARVRVGVSYAFSDGAKIGPVIGAALTSFAERRDEGVKPQTVKLVAPFYFVGVGGYFDVLSAG